MPLIPEIEMLDHQEDAHHHDCLLFPRGFLWGAATSAHQVEGGTTNDWSAWEQVPGHIKDGTTAQHACDHYHRYAEDFSLAKEFGHTVHRLSIEWSRIEPKRSEWDQAEIEHYRQVLSELRRLGIKSMVTLYHFTLPIWFAERGGWLHPRAVPDFLRFVEKVADELGDLVDFWITINEPWVYATQGYLYGTWPPQQKDRIGHALRVVWKLSRAHRGAYRIIHQRLPQAQVGFANNCLSMEAYRRRSLLDFLYVATTSWVWNHSFLRLTGRKRNDFLGVNYYYHQRLMRRGLAMWKLVDVRTEAREHSELGWEIYPEGLFHILFDYKDYKLPIFVTENGIATSNDRRRIRYLITHVREVHNALSQGVDVRGYIHWALLDNFEWDKGLAPRFGLIEVNYQTQQRTVRPSAKVLRDIIKKNSLCHELLMFLGHSVEYRESPDKVVSPDKVQIK